MDNLRYPIGEFTAILQPTEEQRKRFVGLMEQLPDDLRRAVDGLEPQQLNTPYRDGGWTVQQVVHHVADANMNAYIRFKRGLTEVHPLASSFREDLFAQLSDSWDTPVEISILLIEALHHRFVKLLVALKSTDFDRRVTSPTHGDMSLDTALQRYLWHTRHHIAQITSLRERMKW